MKQSTAAYSPDDIRNVRDVEAPVDDPSARRAPSPRLTALAEAMGGLSDRPPYSPIVLAGIVRFTEFALLCITGLLVHTLYVVPQVGFNVAYVVLTVLVSGCAVLGLHALAATRSAAYACPSSRA